MAASDIAARVSRLRTIRGMPLASDAPKILALLTELSNVQMSLELLKETSVGMEVNNRFYRHHRNKGVKAQSSALISQWRTLAIPSSGRDTMGSLSSPVSALYAMASPSDASSVPGTPVPDPQERPAELSAELSAAEFFARCKAAAAIKSPAPREKKQAGLKTPERSVKKTMSSKHESRQKSTPDVLDRIIKAWQKGRHVMPLHSLEDAAQVVRRH